MSGEHIREVTYRSGALDLKAWIYTPAGAEASPAPALVYLHPGNSGAARAWIRDTKPFLDAGFVVMLPTFRGEVGNPGYFEDTMGEVDDAKAAIIWLSTQPVVDRERIYAFGWSYGGGISALLSLFDDMPLRHSASSGGLFSMAVLDEFARMGWPFPYDRSNPEEGRLRVLVGNIRWMKRRHYAYMGSADSTFVPAIAAAKEEMSRGRSHLQIIMVPGEHFRAGGPALLRYFDLILREHGAPGKAGPLPHQR
jgi:hypothetical protein